MKTLGYYRKKTKHAQGLLSEFPHLPSLNETQEEIEAALIQDLRQRRADRMIQDFLSPPLSPQRLIRRWQMWDTDFALSIGALEVGIAYEVDRDWIEYCDIDPED